MKYKEAILIKKPKLNGYFPILTTKTAQAFYKYIFLPESLYNEIQNNINNYKTIAVLEHELTHIKRQQQEGYIKWIIKYLFSNEFRLNEEIMAIKEQMKYLKSFKQPFDIEQRAKWLSSWVYFKCVDYKTAHKLLSDLWGSI